MAEPIDIVVKDSISPAIRDKLLNIAQAALEGANSIERLQKQLKLIDGSTLNKLAQAQKALAAVQAQSVIQQARQSAAQASAATATQRLAQATTNAAAAQTRAGTAQTQAAAAAQRLATATAQTEAAQNRAALAALRLQNAQDRIAKTGAALPGVFSRIAAALGVAFSVRAVVELGDAYTTLQNKLQNVAESQGQVTELTNRLFELANRTRAPVEETATAFTRFDRALKGLGKSQDESLRITETVNKALVISGATATESASALLQLSQAFNAGKLQGDEFRSVSENMPIVLDAIAKATGTPINQIKKLATEGKITSEVLYKAFKVIENQVDATFSKTVPTVAQSLVVLRNNALQTFGEFNKAVGLTEGLAKIILILANNIKIVSVALTVLGAAMLVAFAPAIIAGAVALVAAVSAIAGPIALAVVGITAASAALIAYGDSANVASDSSVTFKDIARGAFDAIVESAKTAANYLSIGFDAALNAVSQAFIANGLTASEAFDAILSAAKTAANFLIASFVAANRAVAVVFTQFPALAEAAFKTAANFAASSAEAVINSWQSAFRVISDLLKNVAPDTAASINSTLDSLTLKLPRLEIGSDAQSAAKELANVFDETFNRDFVGDAKKGIIAIGKAAADSRQEMERLMKKGNPSAQLRGAGPNTTVADPDKAAESRARFLAKQNGELDKQLKTFGEIASVRAVEQKLDEIDIQLASKKLKTLSAPERDLLKAKLETIEVNKRVQQSQDSIYENAIGAQQNYKDATEAVQILEYKGLLTKEKIVEAQKAIDYAYQNSTDPLFQYNLSIKDQNALLDANLDLKERNARSAVQQINQQLAPKGQQLDPAQAALVERESIALQKRNEFQAAYDAIIASSKGARETLVTQQAALNKAYENGKITLDAYSISTTQLAIETAKLKLQLGDASQNDIMLASIGTLLESYKGLAAGMSEAFGGFFTQLKTGFADAAANAIVFGGSLSDALLSVARGAVQQLLSSLIQLGIQWAIQQALGTQSTVKRTAEIATETAAQTAAKAAQTAAAVAALATITTANVVAAATVAAAWAPAAAATTLASFGANSVPAALALAETYALSSALSAMAGFQKGGYTGDAATGQIAGVVHGQEFVMNAAATAANRGTLEAMNAGSSVGNSGPAKVVIEDHTSGGVAFESARGLSDGEIRLIARDEAKAVVRKETGDVMSSELANPNSRASRAIGSNYQVQRSR